MEVAAILGHRRFAVVQHLLEERLFLERVDERHGRHHVLCFDDAPTAP
jgi:hypothetical protein